MRLGSIVVYADFGRLILCTKKSRVADALGYIEYITASMKNKELFHAIDLKLINCWECVMWLDAVSFALILISNVTILTLISTVYYLGKIRDNL